MIRSITDDKEAFKYYILKQAWHKSANSPLSPSSPSIFEKNFEFNQLITHDVWIGSAAIFIIVEDVGEDLIPVLFGKVDFLQLNAQHLPWDKTKRE